MVEFNVLHTTAFTLQNSSKVDKGKCNSVCCFGLAFYYRYANYKSYDDPKLTMVIEFSIVATLVKVLLTGKGHQGAFWGR